VRAKHNPLILSPTALKKDFPGNKLKHPMGKKKRKKKKLQDQAFDFREHHISMELSWLIM
jgi:hypothetical protein